MLVLTRKIDEKVRIGNDITVTVVKIDKGTVKLGIEAPEDIGITREERGRETSQKTSIVINSSEPQS